MTQSRRQQSTQVVDEQDRHPLMTTNDINMILVNGAQTALSKLKRAQSFNARLYYYTEIAVFLEVSLSRDSGILDDTRQRLEEVHQEATRAHMDANKLNNLIEA